MMRRLCSGAWLRFAPHGDRGSSAVFFAVLAPMLLALAGLVIDGGSAIVNKQRAADVALEAARLAANQCDEVAFRENLGCEIADIDRACSLAEQFVQREATHDDVVAQVPTGGCQPVDLQPSGNARGFSVRVRLVAPTYMLSMVHIDHTTVESVQTARSYTREG